MLDALTNGLGLGLTNLMQPAVLFFALGLIAALVRSDLGLPGTAAKNLSLFLMLCIGFKGGVEARLHGLDTGFMTAAALGLILSLSMPLAAFALLRWSGLDRLNAAATAAYYGSVSVVTFAAAQTYLASTGMVTNGYMSAVLAVMETPAILTALWLASRTGAVKLKSGEAGKGIWSHVFFNGASLLLVGSFIIGMITGKPGGEKLAMFTGPLFQGALCLFLLDLGVNVANFWRSANTIRPSALSMAIILPLAGASIGALAARALGLPLNDATLMAILAGSASYIAAPAAMRLALPQADSAVSLSLALGISFPFNLILGIPLYTIMVSALYR
jgi:hypothetical protein